MRLGKRERAAKKERLKLSDERNARIMAVSGPALPTGFNRWPVGKPRCSWGFSEKAGAPAIKPFWKATRFIAKEGTHSHRNEYLAGTKLLEG